MPRPVSPEAAFEFTPEPWVVDAACRGASQSDRALFFGTQQQEPADKFCAFCPVAWKCFDYAIRLDMRDGLWGGIPQWDRRVMLRDNYSTGRLQADHGRRIKALRNKNKKAA